MRLRRKPSAVSRGRRQRRQDADLPKPAPSFAYRSRRSDQEVNTGRQLARKPEVATDGAGGPGRFLLRRFGLLLLLAAVAVLAVSLLSLSGDARVVFVDDAGSPLLQNKQVYSQAADKLLADSIWNHNKITVDSGNISHQLLRQFPELADASVTLPLFAKRPIVYLQPATPSLILVAKNGSFVVDTGGKALLRADNLPSDSRHDLVKVMDKSGLEVKIGQQALSSSNIDFIRTVTAQLAASKVGISSMVLPAGTSELDVGIAGQPYIVKFNLQNNDARQQAGTYLAARAKILSQHIKPAHYVDVRVDGRAYYK